jgi:hypothetical protein
MQALGSYLFVPLEESSPAGEAAEITAWDMSQLGETTPCDPVTGEYCARFLWNFPTLTSYAAVAGIVKLSDARFLLATAGQDSNMFEFYVSGLGAISDPTLFYSSGKGFFDRADVPEFRAYYQHISLLTACSSTGNAGQLYLLGTTSATPQNSGDDYADLFTLDITPVADPRYPASSYTVVIRPAATRHLYCSSNSYARQCDFTAAAGTYVDPSGRLILYASEHDNDGPPGAGPGGSIKMMEFRQSDHLDNRDTDGTVEGCNDINDAFVEFYDASLGPAPGPTTALPAVQRSYMIDFPDRHRRSSGFSNAYGFDNLAMSVRYCIPPGYQYRLFSESTLTGLTEVLRGDSSIPGTGTPSAGAIRGYNWNLNPSWSSGCFGPSGAVQCGRL